MNVSASLRPFHWLVGLWLLLSAAISLSICRAQTVTPTWQFADIIGRTNGVLSVTITPQTTAAPSPYFALQTPIRVTRAMYPGLTNGTFTTNVYTGVNLRFDVSDAYATYSTNYYFPTNLSGAVAANPYKGRLGLDQLTFYYAAGPVAAPTNYPASAITNAPWLTNNSIGVTLSGTFSGSGLGLTNVSAYNPSYNAGAPQAVATVGLQGQFTETRNLSYFYGTGDNMASLPNSATSAFTNLVLNTSGSTTGNVSVANNVATLTIGSSNSSSSAVFTNTVLNQPSVFNSVTTNFLPPFTSGEWLSLNGMNLATYRNGEYWLCERTNQGLYWAWIPVPFGTTNIIASVTGRSKAGTTTPNFGFYNSGWVDQKSPTFTTTFSSLTFTCNAAAITSGNSNILFAISCNNAIMVLSNNISLQYFPPLTDPVLSQPFTRYQVRPENYVGDGGIPSLGNGKPFATQWPNVDTSRVGSHSYVEFSTAATNLTLETMCWNSGSLSIYTNGNYFTNLSIGAPNPVCRVFPITLSGNYNVIRVYTYHATADTKASNLRAIYVPRDYGVQFSKDEPQRRVWAFGDSILSSIYVTTGGFANDVGRVIESWQPLRWLSDAQGGQSLFNVWSNSYQRRLTVLDSLAECNPSDIWIQMGFNDWNNNTFSGTNNFRNAYLDAVQTFHQYAPRATIYCQQPLFTTWSGSSTGGLTIQQYRDAVASVARQCSNYCVNIDASTWITSGDLSDQIHPTESGMIKYGANIAENLWTNRIVVRP